MLHVNINFNVYLKLINLVLNFHLISHCLDLDLMTFFSILIIVVLGTSCIICKYSIICCLNINVSSVAFPQKTVKVKILFLLRLLYEIQ